MRRYALKYSIVIPVFNEQGNLTALYDRLKKTLDNMGETYEIIFIDDGSSDNSYQIIKALGNSDRAVKTIRFTRNFGQHPAVIAGLHSAKGQIIITIDADLQNPPEEIPRLVASMDEGNDIVFGVFKRPEEPAYRRAGSAFAKWILSKMMPSVPTNLSGFRAIRADVIHQFMQFGEKQVFIDALLCWMGYKIGIVEVERHIRYSGKSKYNIFKLAGLWLDMVVAFTNLPLRFAMLLGSILGLIGIIMGVIYLVFYFVYGVLVPGFTTTIILITTFAGVQLLCVGIVGEYIGRIDIQMKKRPDYIIREQSDID